MSMKNFKYKNSIFLLGAVFITSQPLLSVNPEVDLPEHVKKDYKRRGDTAVAQAICNDQLSEQEILKVTELFFCTARYSSLKATSPLSICLSKCKNLKKLKMNYIPDFILKHKPPLQALQELVFFPKFFADKYFFTKLGDLLKLSKNMMILRLNDGDCKGYSLPELTDAFVESRSECCRLRRLDLRRNSLFVIPIDVRAPLKRIRSGNCKVFEKCFLDKLNTDTKRLYKDLRSLLEFVDSIDLRQNDWAYCAKQEFMQNEDKIKFATQQDKDRRVDRVEFMTANGFYEPHEPDLWERIPNSLKEMCRIFLIPNPY
jgi:hypothetical protein